MLDGAFYAQTVFGEHPLDYEEPCSDSKKKIKGKRKRVVLPVAVGEEFGPKPPYCPTWL